MLPPTAHPARTLPRLRLVVASVSAVALLAAACSSSGSPDSAPKSSGGSEPGGGGTRISSAGQGSAAGGSTVDVKNFAFGPKSLDVAVGTKVTWKFEDSAKHTVVADDKSFKSDALSSGKTYSFTFTRPGTYSYICSIHQYMTGTIVVK